MDTHRFDDLARLLGWPAARRRFVLGLAGAVGGLTSHGPHSAVAKRRKEPRLNEFGCVNVGEPCRGRDRLCCSGVCQGKKPKEGRKDRSRCVAHGASTCRAGQRDADQCSGAENVVCTTSTGATNGRCNTTTGNAPYCAAELYGEPCRKDADCQPNCGEAAACILCSGSPSGRACASPTVGLCQFPD
jgi:hypothetical protein